MTNNRNYEGLIHRPRPTTVAYVYTYVIVGSAAAVYSQLYARRTFTGGRRYNNINLQCGGWLRGMDGSVLRSSIYRGIFSFVHPPPTTVKCWYLVVFQFLIFYSSAPSSYSLLNARPASPFNYNSITSDHARGGSAMYTHTRTPTLHPF